MEIFHSGLDFEITIIAPGQVVHQSALVLVVVAWNVFVAVCSSVGTGTVDVDSILSVQNEVESRIVSRRPAKIVSPPMSPAQN